MDLLQPQPIMGAVSKSVVSGVSVLSALNWGALANDYFNQYVPLPENQMVGRVAYALVLTVLGIFFQRNPPLSDVSPSLSAYIVGAITIIGSVAWRDIVKEYLEKFLPIESKFAYAVAMTVLAIALQQWLM